MEDEMVEWHCQLNGHEFDQRKWRTGNPHMHGVAKSQTRLSD